MFKLSHHASIAVRQSCSFLRTYPSFRSVAYIYVSSAKKASWNPGVWEMSFIYKLYIVGARTKPCGTPASISLWVDISPSTETLNCLWDRYGLINFIKLNESCNFDNSYNKSGCHVLSKAFSIFKNTATMDILLLKCRVTWSVSLLHWIVVLWRARNPNWFASSKLLNSRWLCISFLKTLSKSSTVVDGRLIGR